MEGWLVCVVHGGSWFVNRYFFCSMKLFIKLQSNRGLQVYSLGNTNRLCWLAVTFFGSVWHIPEPEPIFSAISAERIFLGSPSFGGYKSNLYWTQRSGREDSCGYPCELGGGQFYHVINFTNQSGSFRLQKCMTTCGSWNRNAMNHELNHSFLVHTLLTFLLSPNLPLPQNLQEFSKPKFVTSHHTFSFFLLKQSQRFA